jgi:hypothetical protein
VARIRFEQNQETKFRDCLAPQSRSAAGFVFRGNLDSHPSAAIMLRGERHHDSRKFRPLGLVDGDRAGQRYLDELAKIVNDLSLLALPRAGIQAQSFFDGR